MECPKCGKTDMIVDIDTHGVRTVNCFCCGYQDCDKYPRRPGEREQEYQNELLEETRIAVHGIKPKLIPYPLYSGQKWLELATIIRAGMDRMNLTPGDLARKAGISYSSVNTYLSGISRPNIRQAMLLEKTLKINLKKFYPKKRRQHEHCKRQTSQTASSPHADSRYENAYADTVEHPHNHSGT